MNRRRFLSLGIACGTGLISQTSLLRCRDAVAESTRFPAAGVWTERMQPLMGTFVSIAIFDEDSEAANRTISAAFSNLEGEISQISDWDPTSAISRLNSTREISVDQSPSTLSHLLPLALRISQLSGFAFSPLTLELTKLWREARQSGAVPPRGQIEALRRQVIQSSLQTGSAGFRLKGQSGVELGGIGKGFLVDRTADFLIANGVKIGRVAGSGDIRFIGNLNWRVEIEHPRSDKMIIGSCRISGPAGVATSGDYRNFTEIGGKRYHHLISLEDGMPARWNRAVTVQARSAALADGLSTAAFMMPAKNAVRFLERLPGTEGVIVDSTGDIHKTSGMKFRRS